MGIQLMSPARILYTYTDEAPALATYSLLPIIQAFTRAAGVTVETRDISLAGRILASFPDELPPDKRRPDDLAELGDVAKTPDANIIKLPNISASVPQLQAAIRELQQHGYPVPDYPEDPADDREKAIKAKYAKVLGSAVNPVLREGNSDRRVASAVKAYARTHPHSMGTWSRDSKTHVAHMTGGDFYGSEQSSVITETGTLRIELLDAAGKTTVLKEGVKVDVNDVVAASVMSRRALQAFFAQAVADAKSAGVLLSLHLKATMMKVSDPIMFGHAVREYYGAMFELLDAAGKTTVLKEGVKVDVNDVVAASVMSRRALQAFFAQAVADAKSAGVLLSLHLKATMMKVSDPIMFGHAVREYYGAVFEKHAALLESIGVDPDNGIGDLFTKIQALPPAQRDAVEADIEAVYATRPPLAMVDSGRGIT